MTATDICNTMIAATSNAKEIGGKAASYYPAFVEAVKVVEAAANGDRVIKRKFAEATIAIEDFYYFYQDAIIQRTESLYGSGVRSVAFHMIWSFYKTWARVNNYNFHEGIKCRDKIEVTTDCVANRKKNAPFLDQCEKSAAIWENFSDLYFSVADARNYKVKKYVKQMAEEKRRMADAG